MSNIDEEIRRFHKLAVDVIRTLDASAEVNSNDYTSDLGALRHRVDLVLNHGFTHEKAVERNKKAVEAWEGR